MTAVKRSTAIAAVLCALAVAGCNEATKINPFGGDDDPEASTTSTATSVKIVERDVEAPDVFQQTEKGLWDGRPSLGGVWVAHPDSKDPERVIIRNEDNGKFVIGALFRRERETPGPVFQVSSDAAEALGMLAGQPVSLNVTALRKEEVPVEPEATATAQLDAPDQIESQTLEDPIAVAGAAIAAVEASEAAAPAAAAPVPAPAPKPTTTSKLDKPYVQIGIFSVEDNAKGTAEAMRQHGVIPTVKKQTTAGKTFWRVIVGPASSKSDRNVLLKKVQGLGFEDAYFVSS
ncbi:SPOR domain-containing protein [Pseudoruegeria sp. SHC-113]|uniref:SPOR domain-containing protein n=1 Tax=Pseudoruegeria sp. SHC-113 TaxID=2855439 RepID=UPI0021BB559C|nr:SPOR domain-containing protein [Pseudoruegeria sp. SHC-113]MCT8159358.1 SPOR domain-containing protein [Pseudoruegeria sp. SHC-113]